MLVDLKIVTKKIDANGDPYEDEYIVKLDGSFLTLSEDMLSGNNLKAIDIPIDSDVAELKLSNIKPGTPVFNIKYITAETSRYLKELKNIIERSKPNWYFNDLDTPLNDFADLVIEAGLKNEEMVFLEPIIYALTRDQNNILKLGNITKNILRIFPFFYNHVICSEETAKLSINRKDRSRNRAHGKASLNPIVTIRPNSLMRRYNN